MKLVHYHPLGSDKKSGSWMRDYSPLFKDYFDDFYDESDDRFSFKMNVYETADFWEYFVELPGVKEEDLKVSFEDRHIKVSGTKRFEDGFGEITKYPRREIGEGYFERWLHLHDGADVENIKAKLKDGVLRVTVPKLELATVKMIEVESEA